VDVYEDEHNVTLKMEVPGVDEKDIDVCIENTTLTVHGERKIEKEEKGGELPSGRAAVRRVHPVVHAAQLGRSGASERPL
jgi:HSP20 family molecular chaperone IbpA